MKKIIFSILTAAAFFLTSCASLQQDIYTSSSSSVVFDSIQEVEDTFIDIDCNYICSHNLSYQQVQNLLNSIDTSDQHQEPALKARLLSIKGLLYLYQGKASKAKETYIEARVLQANDSYTLLLASRLEKSNADQLDYLNNILRIENDDAVILTEKAKVLYLMQSYDLSLASIDKAFLIFSKNSQENYRTGYAKLQENIWRMYKLTNNFDLQNNITAKELQNTLTVQSMIEYTVNNSTLLNFFTAGNKYKTSDLVKKLEKAGYFSSVKDKENQNKSSLEITKSKKLTRKNAARFLWNVYIKSQGKNDLASRYSDYYTKLSQSHNVSSPIADIKIEDSDFDAVLGMVENQIMELPDGKNFYPSEAISLVDYLNCLKLFKN